MWIALAIAAGIVLVLVAIYNSLVGAKNRVENAFAGIDVLLKKRYDLIPDLVAAVQQSMAHEQETLTNITAIRSRVMSGRVSDQSRVELENRLSQELGKLQIALEAYPDLKANQNILQLQAALNEVEEQISASRRFYNTAVTDYNNAVEMFPTNLFASAMNYRRKALFEAPATERQKRDVGELFNR